MKIEFEPEGHIYKVNGQIYPSVSEIIDSTGMVNKDYFTGEHRIRGKTVHEVTEIYDDENLDWLKLPLEFRGYLIGYEKFIKEIKPIFFETEKKVASKLLRFAGTLDRTAKINGTDYIIDFKTSKAKQKTWRLQLAGYQIAYLEMTGRKLETASLRLHPDGKYFLDFYSETQEQDAAAFAGAVQLYYFKK